MQRIWLTVAAGCLLALGFQRPAPAAEPVPMQEVVVTATRTPTALDKVGGSAVSLVTEEEIAAKKQTSIAEVLKGLPGLDVLANGGPGSSATVFTRGADSRNTLVLIDGIMVNDPSSPDRGADLANLTVDNIERIEVVRGPLGALYGSNATAGVINIITKTGRGKPTAFLGGEFGSYNTWKAYGGGSGEWKKLHFALAGSRTETDGFSFANDDNSDIPRGINTDEDDGWENTTLSGKFGLDISENFDVSAVIRHIDSEVDIDDFAFGGFTADEAFPGTGEKQKQETDQLFYGVEVHNRLFGDRFDSRFFYRGADQERETFDGAGESTGTLEGRSLEGGWQGGWRLADWNTLSLGYTYFEERLDQTDSHAKDADIHSYWLSDQLFFFDDRLVVVGGLRVDDHERFGSETTWQLAPSYRFQATGTTLKGSYGTGFRAPSLFELFADANLAWFFAGGNTELDPEESEGWDAGFEQELLDGNVRCGATYFYTRFQDKIEYVTDPVTFLGTYANLQGTTTTQGIEAFLAWTPTKDVSLRLDYTFTETEDPDDKDLVLRPKHKVHLNGRWRLLAKTTLNLDAYWVDERKATAFDRDQNGFPVEALDDYFLVNLAASYDLNEHLQIYGRIDNLFDEFYEERWSYATPGFSVFGGVKLQL